MPKNFFYKPCRQFVLLIVTGLLIISPLKAEGLFVDVAYIGSNINIADQSFKPTLFQFGLGWQFSDRLSVELTQASSDSSDRIGSVEASIESMSSVLLRYGSPVNSTVNVYVTLGHSEINLVMNGNSVQSDEDYAGTSWGFGYEERLSAGSDFRLHFDYIQRYRLDELTVDSFQLGLRYVF